MLAYIFSNISTHTLIRINTYMYKIHFVETNYNNKKKKISTLTRTVLLPRVGIEPLGLKCESDWAY